MPCVEHRFLRELEHTVLFEGCHIVYNGIKRNGVENKWTYLKYTTLQLSYLTTK